MTQPTSAPGPADAVPAYLEPADDLLSNHAGLARAVARRYDGRGVPLAEIEQVAVNALLRAVADFELPRRTVIVDFVTYALPYLRGDVKLYFRSAGGRLDKVPPRVPAPVIDHPMALDPDSAPPPDTTDVPRPQS